MTQTEKLTTEQQQPNPQATVPAPQPQTITAPEGQQVQYVVAKKSLEGLGGWLAVWLVVCGLAGIGYIGAGIGTEGSSASFNGVELPAPVALFLGIAFFVTAVLIAMRKKYGIWASIATVVASALISTVTTATSDTATANVGGVFVINALVAGLFSLYFLKSERVKLTLTK